MKKKLIGALTSKPYAFNARSWELKSIETIDILDIISPNIKINIRGSNILRILPSINENKNNEWITDKTRFAFDGLYKWRFNTPLIKYSLYKKFYIKDILTYNFLKKNYVLKKNKEFYVPIGWKNIINIINSLHNTNENIYAFGGYYVDLESLIIAKDLINKSGFNNYKIDFTIPDINNDFCFNYLYNDFNTYYLKKKVNNKKILILGSNLRLESPLINFKYKKSQLKNIFYIGSYFNSTFNLIHFSTTPSFLIKFLEGKTLFSKNFIKKTKSLQILVGFCLLKRIDISNILNTIKHKKLLKFLDIDINVLYNKISQINAYEINFKQNLRNKNKKLKNHSLLYLLNTDNLNILNLKNKNNNISVYLGYLNDQINNQIDIILPVNNFFEKNSMFLNFQGKLTQTKGFKKPSNLVRNEWKIFKIICSYRKINLTYKTVQELNNRLYTMSPALNKIRLNYNYKLFKINNIFNLNKLYLNPIKSTINNYYTDDYITRTSKIMRNCFKYFEKFKLNYPKD